jgi:lambda repressor-like predicted transcriptional regulator
MAKTPEYLSWQHAKKRCNDPKDKEFHRYGAKGVKMCPEWEIDFAAFYRELGPRPSKAHTLDRIVGPLGYRPGNVRWATRALQAQNRPEFVRPITLGARTMTIAEWARDLNLHPQTLYARLNRGMTPEAALIGRTLPRGLPARNLTHMGKTNSLKGWAREVGLNPTTLRERLKRGWTLESALSPEMRAR